MYINMKAITLAFIKESIAILNHDDGFRNKVVRITGECIQCYYGIRNLNFIIILVNVFCKFLIAQYQESITYKDS